MSENIMSVSRDSGATATVPFAEIAKDGNLSTNFFKEYLAEHPDTANVVISFAGLKGVFNSLEGVEFALDRAEKTLGTYVTRVNKIVSGIDPNTRQARSGSSASSTGKKAPVGVEMLDAESVHLFAIDGESEAEVNVSGAVTTNDYDTLSYFIDAVLHPRQWTNRISQLRQFAGGKEATPPSYTISLKGVTLDLGSNEPDETAVRKAQAEIAGKLIAQGIYPDAKDIKNAKPEMTGGGEEWLAGWIANAYPAPVEEAEPELETA